MNIILASASPRRKEILENANVKFKIMASSIEELTLDSESPCQMVMRLAFEKGIDIASRQKSDLVISADTIVVLDNTILGKPKDEIEARKMITSLSGRTHQVITGISLINLDNNKKIIDYVISNVKFKKLSEEDMEILENLKNKKTIVLLNKMDLEPKIELEKVKEFVNSEDIIEISALKHQGIEQLQDKIESMVYHGSVKNSSNLMITNSRHKDALFKAYESINDAINAIDQRMPYDFIEVDFKNIWDYLGYINGDTVREDLLDTIFANFCIGK